MAQDSKMTWAQVTADPRYQSASPETRANIAQAWKSAQGDGSTPSDSQGTADTQPQTTFNREGDIVSGNQAVMASEPHAQGGQEAPVQMGAPQSQMPQGAPAATQQPVTPQPQQADDLGHTIVNG